MDLPVTDVTQLDPGQLTHDSVKFCTTQGFKGLEAPVVGLIDVQRLDRRDLIYTAVSRAKSALYVLYDAKLQPEHDAIMTEYQSSLQGEPPQLPLSRRLVRSREEEVGGRPATGQGGGGAVGDSRGGLAGAGTWKPAEARGMTSIREMMERKEVRRGRK